MFRLVSVLSLVLATLPLYAEDPARDEGGPWSGSGEISYVSTGGNTDTSTLGVGLELGYVQPVWSAELSGSFLRSEDGGEERARTITALLGASRELRERMVGYLRTSYLRNPFAGIDRRVTSEAGLGWDVRVDAPHELRLEAGLGHTDERRLLAPDLSFISGRAGAKYRWSLSKTSSVREEISVLTDLEGPGAFRLVNLASLTAGLNSVFALKLSHTLSYVDDPVPGFEKTDTTMSAAIVATW